MAKKKGDKGGNPHPVQNQQLKAKRKQRVFNDPFPQEPLAAKPLSLRLYQFVSDALEEMPHDEKVATLRAIITNFAIEKLGAKPATLIQSQHTEQTDQQQVLIHENNHSIDIELAKQKAELINFVSNFWGSQPPE